MTYPLMIHGTTERSPSPRRSATEATAPEVTDAGESAADGPQRSLLTYPMTWRILGWWSVGYGSVTWLVEWIASGWDQGHARMPFLSGMNRLVYAIVWAGAIVAAIVLTEWRPVTRFRQPGRIALHVAATLVMTVLWAVVAYYICLLVVPGWKPLGAGTMLASTAKSVLFGYILVTILVHIVAELRVHRHMEIRSLRQERLAAQAQLHVLKMEMQPHFLFNALHSISSLIQSDPEAANEVLVGLSDMLRHSMETSRVQQVSLREELDSLRLYTRIERVRFGDRLNINWAIGEDTLISAVPHMLLQPLVENAIRHGIETSSTAGRIDIAAERRDDLVWITISDDGPGVDGRQRSAGGGRGLVNTRARLKELYADRQSLTLVSGEEGGTTVTISLPFAPIAAHGSRETLTS